KDSAGSCSPWGHSCSCKRCQNFSRALRSTDPRPYTAPGTKPATTNRSTMSTATKPKQPTIGQWVPGYAIPVINERAVRAGAGLLFLGGAIAFGFALHTDSQVPLQPFGMMF